jgi:hypothetical protein
MSNREHNSIRILRDLANTLPHLDLSEATERELEALLADARLVQRCLDGLVVRAGARANQLSETGYAPPAPEFLRGDGSVSSSQARRESRRVKAAAANPDMVKALTSGRISGEHIDAIARHTSNLESDVSSRVDLDALLKQAAHLPPETFNRYVKRHVDAARGDHGLHDTLAKQQASQFRHWFDESTGMGRFSGSLDPERYEKLISAVEQRCASLAAEGNVERNPNLAAQALVELTTAAGSELSGQNRVPSITVVVDERTAIHGPHPASLLQTENGHDLAAHSVARMACDATIRRVTLDPNGVPINVGRKYRTATGAQWAALKAIYSSCAWSNCNAPISWCQAHHIHEWEHGGPTDLANLVPLCSQHHHRVHEGQWSIKLKPDRSLHIHKPDGGHHATTEPPGRSNRHATRGQPCAA